MQKIVKSPQATLKYWPTTHQNLQLIATMTGESMSAIAHRVIKAELDQLEREYNEVFIEAMEAAEREKMQKTASELESNIDLPPGLSISWDNDLDHEDSEGKPYLHFEVIANSDDYLGYILHPINSNNFMAVFLRDETSCMGHSGSIPDELGIYNDISEAAVAIHKYSIEGR